MTECLRCELRPSIGWLVVRFIPGGAGRISEAGHLNYSYDIDIESADGSLHPISNIATLCNAITTLGVDRSATVSPDLPSWARVCCILTQPGNVRVVTDAINYSYLEDDRGLRWADLLPREYANGLQYHSIEMKAFDRKLIRVRVNLDTAIVEKEMVAQL